MWFSISDKLEPIYPSVWFVINNDDGIVNCYLNPFQAVDIDLNKTNPNDQVIGISNSSSNHQIEDIGLSPSGLSSID